MTTVADLLIPAWQFTQTLRPLLIFVSMKAYTLGNWRCNVAACLGSSFMSTKFVNVTTILYPPFYHTHFRQVHTRRISFCFMFSSVTAFMEHRYNPSIIRHLCVHLTIFNTLCSPQSLSCPSCGGAPSSRWHCFFASPVPRTAVPARRFPTLDSFG